MSKELFQVFVVVLRESMEALFIVAMLSACVSKLPRVDMMRARWALRLGVATGVGLSFALAYALLGISHLLEGDTLDYFQCALMLCAACMMLQTALWVGKRSCNCRIDEQERVHPLSLGLLCALAVAREGSETSVFMYGVVVAADKTVHVPVVIAGAMALIASVVLFGLVRLSSRAIARTLFFRICESIFFVIAGSLLLGAIDRLIALGLVSTLTPPLWDSSRILDDSGPFGQMISGLTGYRSRPELIVVLVLGIYWIAVAGLLRLRSRQAVTR